jgi:hypothetical protein
MAYKKHNTFDSIFGKRQAFEEFEKSPAGMMPAGPSLSQVSQG